MKDVLHLPDNEKERLGSFAKVQNDINKGSDQYELATANAIWPATGPEWYYEFLDIITGYYDGKVKELDYAADPESCRKTINNWVENRTNDRIKDLIPEGDIDIFTYMVLTNAIYFKGEWIYEFNEDETDKAPFYSPSGEVEVDMMGMKLEDDNKVPYYLGDDVQALELPYKGDELSMVLVLPSFGTLDDMISDLDNALLEEIRSGLEPSNVQVKMPKLKLETKYGLKDHLIDLGMPTAFSPGSADFSGMSAEGEEVYISKVIHQTFLEVDEEGTEAAAATAVILRKYSAESIPEFNANEPFLFYIQQRDTGNILFMGAIKDPSLSG
ncbi:MAG: serpin family protein, partial [Candidatus Thermoplasmatota archaeon]|nr:serpin family protein [Candidatus Thermoplasmatota archaeon]